MSFDAKPLQIKSLFTKHIFTIPRNQRRYVWNKENWSELYEDLKFIIENKRVMLFLVIFGQLCSSKEKRR